MGYAGTTGQGGGAIEPPNPTADATERMNHRLTLMLFSGIFALAGVGIVVSAIAMSVMGSRHHATILTTAPSSSAVSPTVAAARISLWVAADWKQGPDSQRHDAFSKSDFTVRAGQPVRLTIDNRDDTAHSITAVGAGVNIKIEPGVHTYTLLVSRPGRYLWICAYPCDPFAMGRVGYMQGHITAT